MPDKITTRFLRTCLVLLMTCLTGAVANAQTMNKDAVAALLHIITGKNAYSYKYIVHMAYPNGQKDELSGDIYCDIPHASFLNKSSASVTLLTDKWYMLVDHNKHDAVIYSVPVLLSRDHKSQEFFHDNFRRMMLSNMLDSQLLSHATIQSCVSTGNIVHLQLDFPRGSRLRKLVMELDKEKKVIRNIRINAFYPGRDASGKLTEQAGTEEEIICSDYKAEVPDYVFSTDSYFSVSSASKISLLQFQNYHLKTNL